MSKLYKKVTKDFVVVSNRITRDPNLRLADKGLLTFLPRQGTVLCLPHFLLPEFFSVQTALGDNIIDVGHYVYFVSLTVCITRPVVIPQSSAPIKDTTYLK